MAREYFLTSGTTALVAEQAYYALPSDLVDLYALEALETSSDDEPKDLIQVPLADRDFYNVLDDANKKEDFGFFFVSGTDFKMLPKPSSSISGQQLRIHYVKRLDTLVNNADVSEIPLEHHPLVAMEMARLGQVKLRRQNRALEKLHGERLEALQRTVRGPTRGRQEVRTTPWYGTFGPGSDTTVGF